MSKPHPSLPTRQQILDFIASSDVPAGKREIARAFGLHAQDKTALKALLRDMGDEGLIDSAPGRAFHQMGGVPKVTVLRIAGFEQDGQALTEAVQAAPMDTAPAEPGPAAIDAAESFAVIAGENPETVAPEDAPDTAPQE